MPTTYAIPNGRTVMNATTYSGTGASTTFSNASNGANGFYPDFTWIKARNDTTWHQVFDSIRGANKGLFPNSAYPEVTETDAFNAFTSTGFTLGADVAGGSVNKSGNTYVAWQWNANNGSTVSNTNGTITSTVSVNTTAGFSVATYAGNGTSGQTVGHGLGVIPNMIFVKRRDGTVGSSPDWIIYHSSVGNTKALILDSTSATQTLTAFWNNTSPSSSVFTVGNDVNVNLSPYNYVAYCWAAVAGYSAFGSYVGNGNADGPFVYCGFRPKFILFKRTDSTENWVIIDSSRDLYNVSSDRLYPNTSGVEDTGSAVLDILSNGFKQRNSAASGNITNGTYIYAAFAENPFKYANAR